MERVRGEHEAYKKEKKSDEDYQPSSQEKKLIKDVYKTFEEDKKFRSKYDQDWLDNYKFFRGQQWNYERPSYLHSEVINLVFQSIQSTVPIQTDARPKFEFLPQEPRDRELSEILNELAQSDWEKNNWMKTLTEIIYDCNFYGVAYGSVEWDFDNDNPLGKICFEREDPFYLFVNQGTNEINHKKTKRITKIEFCELSEIKRDYENGKFVKSDLGDFFEVDKTSLGSVEFKSPVDQKQVMVKSREGVPNASDRVLKITRWDVCDEYDEEKVEGKEEYVQKKKYPKGRKVVVAGNVLLEEDHNPYEDGKFPFGKLLNYLLPGEFFGISEVEQLKSPQKIFNRLVSFALDVLVLMGNPIYKVGSSAGVDTDELFNQPGLVIDCDDPSQIQREEGVQLQPFVLQLIDRMAQWFDGISGANDVTRGIRPEGVTAARAIENLQDASQTRLRLKSRLLDGFLQEIGQLWLSRTLQYRTAPEVARLTGKDNAQKYFKFSIDEKEDGSRIMSVMRPTFDEKGNATGYGAPKEIPLKRDKEIISMDVRVNTGSSLPFAKAEKFNTAKELYQLQVIDEEELLKAADYPNWEAVLERVNQKKEQMMQQEAAASQGV